MAGPTGTHTHRSAWYALSALVIVAPLAVGLGAAASWLARPGTEFPVALGTTAVLGLLGGFVVPGLLSRFRGFPPPAPPAHDRGPDGL